MSFFRNSTTITPEVFFSPKIAELSYTVLEKTNYIFGYLKKTGDKVNYAYIFMQNPQKIIVGKFTHVQP